MKKVILDTSFILSATRNKIDFFEKIPEMGLKIIIPDEVIDEIKRIFYTKKGKLKDDAQLALKILEKNNFDSIKLNESYVDKGIKKLVEKDSDTFIATLDRELKKLVNSNVVIRKKTQLEIR
jgi:rRNA-processing protein FCF1